MSPIELLWTAKKDTNTDINKYTNANTNTVTFWYSGNNFMCYTSLNIVNIAILCAICGICTKCLMRIGTNWKYSSWCQYWFKSKTSIWLQWIKVIIIITMEKFTNFSVIECCCSPFLHICRFSRWTFSSSKLSRSHVVLPILLCSLCMVQPELVIRRHF